MKILLILLSIAFCAVGATCPAGYTYYNQTQKCYKVYTTASTYFAASDICREDGGALASIHNAFENTYIYNLFPNKNLDHWIGLTNLVSGYDFEWLDNSPVQYTNWLPGEPNYDASCVLVEAGNAHWASQTCRYPLPFICEYDPAVTHSSCPACPTQAPTTCPTAVTRACPPCPSCSTCPPEKTCPTTAPCSTPAPKPICDNGWRYNANTKSCYFLGIARLTGPDAEEECVKQDAHLASIHSEAENQYIYDWVRGTSNATLFNVWLGAYRTGNAVANFANFDGTPFDYAKWIPGDPNNVGGNEFCVEMQTNFGDHESLWNDAVCANAIPSYMCKKPANI